MMNKQAKNSFRIFLVVMCIIVVSACSSKQVLTSVSGTVRDQHGHFISNASIVIGHATATTDESGSFSIPDVYVGETEIIVLIKGYRPVITPLQLTETPQIVTLEMDFTEPSVRQGDTVDYLLLLGKNDVYDLTPSSGFTYIYGSDIASDATSLLGISNLNDAVNYLTPGTLQAVASTLKAKHIVWIAEELTDHLQIFNAETETMLSIPFETSSRVKKILPALQESINYQVAQNTKTPVIGHAKSLIYHRVDVDHLPPESERVHFDSREEAEAAGYRPDPLCFGASAIAAQTELSTTEEQLARQVTALIENIFRVTYSGPEIDHIRKVAEPIIAVSERTNIPFTFGILETPHYNALALPGGYVFITRSLYEILETDSELAAIISHEIVHITHMHAVKNFVRQGSIDHSYDQEYDADKSGLRYMVKAGFNPDALDRVLRKLRTLQDNLSGGMELFSETHPPTTNRIERVENEMRRVMYYDTLENYLAETKTNEVEFENLENPLD